MDTLAEKFGDIFCDDDSCKEYVKQRCNNVFAGNIDPNKSVFDDMLFCYSCYSSGFSHSPDYFISEMQRAGRAVCQRQFRKNDIVWICRQCQRDDTCVQCNDCFMHSDHKGHDVFFYHSQAGGCCDCGDEAAWASQGFCTKHGKTLENPLSSVPSEVVNIGRALLDCIVDNIVSFVSEFTSAHKIQEMEAILANESKSYEIILYNDDIHTFEHVIEALQSIGIDRLNGKEVAKRVHVSGQDSIFSGSPSDALKNAKDLSKSGKICRLIFYIICCFK